MNRAKFDRDYSDAEHALFARYQFERAQLKPKECVGGDRCWVRFGPPCYDTNGNLGNCVGCGGRVKERGRT
jgi:hypothetical protein